VPVLVPTLLPTPGAVEDPLASVRAVKAFARAAGGVGKALEVLAALPRDMPIARLEEYLKVLAED
jgi:hypothetical protein